MLYPSLGLVLDWKLDNKGLDRCISSYSSIWVVLKMKHSKTKTEASSTQISKTKHPKLENEAPKLENEALKSRKRSTQNSKTKHPKPLYVDKLQL